MDSMTLRDFLLEIKGSLEAHFRSSYWVVAEIASLRVNPNSQHCYIDLIEKDGQAVAAKAGGVIWKGRFDYICGKFAKSTGQQLKDGLKVLLQAEVLFHEIYGFKLNIVDIDPSYTLGEFALHRKKIIAQLEKDGLLNLNKELSLPPVPQRVAIISSASAAGYEDFINTLADNPYGYKFKTELFPAYMQGEQTEESIINALDKCLKKKALYDVVIIIRGGGDRVDLHSFDSYNLGKAVALFPLPVITGIGHQRDETVVDAAAHTKKISPTAVAEFLVGRIKEFEDRLEAAGMVLMNRVKGVISQKKDLLAGAEKNINIFVNFFVRDKKRQFKTAGQDFRNSVAKRIASNEFKLKQMPVDISRIVHGYFKTHANSLDRKGDVISLVAPANVLKRGYSLSFKGGGIIKDAASLKTGDIIETRFYKGKAESTVQRIETGGNK